MNPLAEVNRIELIDHTLTGEGREFSKWEGKPFVVEYSLQDDGRTLKIFLSTKKPV